MTNREWLTSLSDSELAVMINEECSCNCCTHYVDGEYECSVDDKGNICIKGIEAWLNAEHEKPMPELQAGDMFIYTQSQITFYGVCVYDNIVYLPGEDRCYNFGEEIKEKIIAIKRYNISKGTMETIWRADNG